MEEQQVRLPLGLSALIYCPACGELVLDDERAPGSTPVCNHVVFLYIHEESVFEYVTKAYENLLEDDMTLTEAMERLDRSSIFALTMVTGGMACGPVWSTMSIGFDFDPETEEDL